MLIHRYDKTHGGNSVSPLAFVVHILSTRVADITRYTERLSTVSTINIFNRIITDRNCQKWPLTLHSLCRTDINVYDFRLIIILYIIYLINCVINNEGEDFNKKSG